MVAWAKGRQIPSEIESRMRTAFSNAERHELRAETTLSGLKAVLGHRAPKSGKYVGPDRMVKLLENG